MPLVPAHRDQFALRFIPLTALLSAICLHENPLPPFVSCWDSYLWPHSLCPSTLISHCLQYKLSRASHVRPAHWPVSRPCSFPPRSLPLSLIRSFKHQVTVKPTAPVALQPPTWTLFMNSPSSVLCLVSLLRPRDKSVHCSLWLQQLMPAMATLCQTATCRDRALSLTLPSACRSTGLSEPLSPRKAHRFP